MFHTAYKVNKEDITYEFSDYIRLLRLIENHSGVALSTNSRKFKDINSLENFTPDVLKSDYNIVNCSFRVVDFISFIIICHLLTKNNVEIGGIPPKLSILFNNNIMHDYHYILHNRLFVDLYIEFFWTDERVVINTYVNELMAFNIDKKEQEEVQQIVDSLFDLSTAKPDILDSCNNFINDLEEDKLVIIYSNLF